MTLLMCQLPFDDVGQVLEVEFFASLVAHVALTHKDRHCASIEASDELVLEVVGVDQQHVVTIVVDVGTAHWNSYSTFSLLGALQSLHELSVLPLQPERDSSVHPHRLWARAVLVIRQGSETARHLHPRLTLELRVSNDERRVEKRITELQGNTVLERVGAADAKTGSWHGPPIQKSSLGECRWP